MMEAIRYIELSVLARATQRHIPEDGILHSHRRDNPKYYIVQIGPEAHPAFCFMDAG
jgi:hypothetical protein